MIKGMENTDRVIRNNQFDAEGKERSEGRRETKSLILRLDLKKEILP